MESESESEAVFVDGQDNEFYVYMCEIGIPIDVISSQSTPGRHLYYYPIIAQLRRYEPWHLETLARTWKVS